MMSGILVRKRAAVADATPTFLGSNSSTSDLSTYSLAVDLTATSYQYYIIGVASRTASATNSLNGDITLAGNAATTRISQPGANSSGVNHAALAIIASPGVTGSQTIAFTMTNGCVRGWLCVWGVNNLLSATETDTAQSTADPSTATIDVSAGGIIVVVGTAAGTPGAATPVGVSERFDALVEANRFFAGDLASATAQSGLSVGFDMGTPTVPIMVAAAFR